MRLMQKELRHPAKVATAANATPASFRMGQPRIEDAAVVKANGCDPIGEVPVL